MAKTTTRYAAIELHSGYVWGAARATNPSNAAVLIAHAADHSRDWMAEEVGAADPRRTFALYEIADDVVIKDGQATETIQAVEGSRFAAYVHTWDARGEPRA